MAPSFTLDAKTLISAAVSGNIMVLKSFVKGYGEGGVNVLMGVKDKNGRNLLHYAVAGGRTHVCKYLVETLKFDVHFKDVNGDTPLHVAAVEGHCLTSAYLLDHGANPNASGFKEKTPLHCAAEKGRKDQLRLLISKGADVNAESFNGTPLMCAATNNMKDAVDILLKHGANPNTLNHQMYSPLLGAILEGNVDCVRLLLKHGADPNFGAPGFSPLVEAASEEELEIIKCLLKAGANPNATDLDNRTPLEIAAKDGKHAFVRALFPATTRIPHVTDWSVDGILEYANSGEAIHQLLLKGEEKFRNTKAMGADAVKKEDYIAALNWYSEALDAKPTNAAMYSNSSLCWARLNDGKHALAEAKRCIRMEKDWCKGYYRAGVAWNILQNYEEAAKAFRKGLKKEPTNKELQDAYRDAMAKLGETVSDDFNGLFNEACNIDDDSSEDDDKCPICTMFNVPGHTCNGVH